MRESIILAILLQITWFCVWARDRQCSWVNLDAELLVIMKYRQRGDAAREADVAEVDKVSGARNFVIVSSGDLLSVLQWSLCRLIWKCVPECYIHGMDVDGLAVNDRLVNAREIGHEQLEHNSTVDNADDETEGNDRRTTATTVMSTKEWRAFLRSKHWVGGRTGVAEGGAN